MGGYAFKGSCRRSESAQFESSQGWSNGRLGWERQAVNGTGQRGLLRKSKLSPAGQFVLAWTLHCEGSGRAELMSCPDSLSNPIILRARRQRSCFLRRIPLVLHCFHLPDTQMLVRRASTLSFTCQPKHRCRLCQLVTFFWNDWITPLSLNVLRLMPSPPSRALISTPQSLWQSDSQHWQPQLCGPRGGSFCSCRLVVAITVSAMMVLSVWVSPCPLNRFVFGMQ